MIDAASGKILRKLVIGADFAQSVFADSSLSIANQYGVYAWGIGQPRVSQTSSVSRR